MKKFLTNNIHTIFLLLFLVVFVVLSLASALKESLTFDEVVYLQEGRHAVVNRTFDIDPFNPPLAREIGILPYIFDKKFYKSDSVLLTHPVPARAVSIVIGVVLILAVYLFTLEYFGKKEALFSAFLLSFEPTILANSHYVTIDIFLTLFFFLSFWLLLKVFQKGNTKNILALSLAVGFGMATKISFIPYFFLSTIALSCVQFGKQSFSVLKRKIMKIIFVGFLSFIVVWAVYFFHWHVAIKERQDSARVSERLIAYSQVHNMQYLTTSVIFLKTQPIPLGDYLATLKNNTLRSVKKNDCFFLGNTYSSCSWYFLPFNFFLKVPLPLMIFFLISLYLFIKSNKKKVHIFLLIPIGIILVVSMILRMMPLVRYILPFYPFLIIFTSNSLSLFRKTIVTKILFTFLFIWYIAGTLSSFPHFISYANELAFGQKTFLLNDSNIDWGQSLPDVTNYIKEKQLSDVRFSYFGRDNGDLYGLASNLPYGSYKNNEICAFHVIKNSSREKSATLISISNWNMCGYRKLQEFSKEKIKDIIGDSMLVF